MRPSLLGLALLIALAACDRAPPRPIADKGIQRGTALPPPALSQGPAPDR